MDPIVRATLAACAAALSHPAVQAQPQMSLDAAATRHWVLYAGEHRGAPFAVVDTRQALLWWFDARGCVAPGPAVGERPVPENVPHERTKPARTVLAEPR